jgi:hypothetical protein
MRHGVPVLHSNEQLLEILQMPLDNIDVNAGTILATQLTLHGFSDRAIMLLDKLGKFKTSQLFSGYLNQLYLASEQLSSCRIEEKHIAKPAFFEDILSLNISYFRKPGSKKLIIIFATGWNNFGVSLPVFNELLGNVEASILYIKNTDREMYCNGAPGLGDSIDKVASNLQKFKIENGYEDILVYGFSSGGYAALFSAAELRAKSFVGFGIRTNWSIDSMHTATPGRAAPSVKDYEKNTLINMALHPNIKSVSKINLYFGDSDHSDIAHANNLADLQNVALIPVEKSTHNVILHMISGGTFSDVLRTHSCG